jgi:hypothetical protein
MSNEYFKTALHEFTLDFASGGEIRAFADKGYTVSQIKEKLTFPTPIEEVRRVVWKHYIDTGIIKLEEPDSDTKTERVSYEKVQDSLGRTSFKQVTIKDDNPMREYIACDFGKLIYKDRAGFEKKLEALSKEDRDYILELPWPLERVWHAKNERMERISKAFSEQYE